MVRNERKSFAYFVVSLFMAACVVIDCVVELNRLVVYPAHAPFVGALCVMSALSIGMAPMFGAWACLVLGSCINIAPICVDVCNTMLYFVGLQPISVPFIPATMLLASVFGLFVIGTMGGVPSATAVILLLFNCVGMIWQGIGAWQIISELLCAVVALCVGLLVCLQEKRVAAESSLSTVEDEIQDLSVRMSVAAQLHESVTNKLSILIADMELMLMDENGSPTKSSIRDMQSMAQDVLNEAHRAIESLEYAKNDSSRIIDDQLAIQDAPDDWFEQLRDYASQQDERLHHMGCHGCTSFHVFGHGPDQTIANLCSDILEELYVNIMKYADPACGYDMHIATQNNKLVIESTNVCANTHSPSQHNGDGSGLNRFKHALDSIGGSLRYDREPIEFTPSANKHGAETPSESTNAMEWVIRVEIPLRHTEPRA